MSVVYANACTIFFCGQLYRFRDTLETSELVSTTENFPASTWFIHDDGLSNYLLSFQKNPSANFFKNNCFFPDQKRVGHYTHYTNRFTEKWLNFFIKYLLRAIWCGFCCRKCIFFIIIISSSSSSSSGISSSCSSSRSTSNSGGGGASDSGINSTSSCGSSKILTWTGKYKAGAIAGPWYG